MHTATADPLAGRVLEGRYLLQAQLARGGMSVVYTAVDQRLDRKVAVKIMSPSLSADPAFTDRFTREARSAAKLTHLNAVAVYDQGVDHLDTGPVVFLVMELVNGRTLRDLLRERGRLSQAEAVSIMEPVLAALAAAHRAGLVHRDVKPENILLSNEGVVKVADFGLARAVESDGASTRTGLMMGTVAYCAPEQVSRGSADQRSDVYSAGIVLFELLTGSPPYTGDSAVNIAYQHVHGTVPAPSSRVPGIGPSLDRLVQRATDSEPSGRPLDAGAFLAELADVRTDLGLPVVPVPQRPRAQAASAAPAPGVPTLATELLGGADTTGPLRTGNSHDRTTGYDTVAVDRDPYRSPTGAQPVIVPPGGTGGRKPPRRRSARSIRRRRGLLILVVLLLLGTLAGVGGWWLVAGRYSNVPVTIDDSPAAAASVLRSAGYKVSPTDEIEFSPIVKAGEVIRTDPSAGSRAARGSTVTLVVSKGPDLIPIPTVQAGSTPAQALQVLGTQFNIVQVQQPSQADPPLPSGQVIGTDPAGGQKLGPGSTVKLLISTGAPIVSVPSVTGLNQQDALAKLHAAGFTMKATSDYSTTVPQGQAISQTPNGTAPKYSTVTVDFSKGPPTVTVPNIANGTPVDSARSQLQSMGLQVKLVKSYGGFLGLVVGMSLDKAGNIPAAGQTVPIGTTIYITYV